MRVVTEDWECGGNALCAKIDPELFRLDDDGFVVIPEGGLEVPSGKEETAHRAITACPMDVLRSDG